MNARSSSVLSGDGSVIEGEGRGDAIFGVVLESLVLLAGLLLLFAVIRQFLVLSVVRRRWCSAPWLPGEIVPGQTTKRSASQPILFVPTAGLDPANTLSLTAWRRKDRELLGLGDQVWLAAPRRSRGHHRSPYAVIRPRDHSVFWSTGHPLPGDNW